MGWVTGEGGDVMDPVEEKGKKGRMVEEVGRTCGRCWARCWAGRKGKGGTQGQEFTRRAGRGGAAWRLGYFYTLIKLYLTLIYLKQNSTKHFYIDFNLNLLKQTTLILFYILYLIDGIILFSMLSILLTT